MNRADALIAELQRERPWAVRLAELASPAAHIDPALLRRLRQQLLPAADPGAEADLWFSPLVSAHEPGACALHDEVVLRLRERIATDTVRCGRAIAIIREAHAELPEALRVEEALTALALQGNAPVEPAVEAALQPALRAIAGTDAAHALEVARWALQAAPRFAPALREAAAMQALLVAAALRVESADWPAGVRPGQIPADHLAWLLPADAAAMPQVSLSASITPKGVRFDAPGSAAPTLALPQTRPLLLSLRWPVAGGWQSVLTPVEAGAEVALQGTPQQVELTTLAGARYRLAAPTAAGAEARGEADLATQATSAPQLLSIVRKEGGFEFGFSGDAKRMDLRSTASSTLADALLARLAAAIAGDPGLTMELAKVLLDPGLRDAIDTGTGPMLLHLDDGAARLPWELILQNRQTEDPIDNRPRAVRTVLVRQLSETDGFRVARPNHEHSALVIGNPSVAGAAKAFLDANGTVIPQLPSLPGAERACEAVATQLSQGGYAVDRMTGETANAADVLSATLRKAWRILHIAAHGIHKPRSAKNIESIGILLSDGLVLSAQEIESMQAVPALVFLDCCHLGPHRADPALMGQDGQLAARLAHDLLAIGVSCVVVAGRVVNDALGPRFSEVFYERLMQAATFGEAMLAARQALWLDVPQDLTWGAYQAYGDAEHRLAVKPPPEDDEELDAETMLDRATVQIVRDGTIIGAGVFVSPHQFVTLGTLVDATRPADDPASEAAMQVRFGGAYGAGRMQVRDTETPLALVAMDTAPHGVRVMTRRHKVAATGAAWQSVAAHGMQAFAVEGTMLGHLPTGERHIAHMLADSAPLPGAPVVVSGQLAGLFDRPLARTQSPEMRAQVDVRAIDLEPLQRFLRWALRPGEHEPWIALGATDPGDALVTAELARIERALQAVRLRPMPVRLGPASNTASTEPWIETLNAAHGAVRLLARSAVPGPTPRDLLMLAYRAWADPPFPFLALSLQDDGEALPPSLANGREPWSSSTELPSLQRLLHHVLDRDAHQSPDPGRLGDDLASLAHRISPDDEDIDAGLRAVADRGLGAASKLLALWLRRAQPDQANQLLEGAAMLALPGGQTLETLRAAAQAPPGQRSVCVNAMPVLIARWLLAKAWYPGPPPAQVVIRDQQWPSPERVDTLVAQVRAQLCKALACEDDDARWLLAHATAPFAIIFATRPLPAMELLARLRRELPAALLFFLAGNEPVPPEQARALGLRSLDMRPGETSLRLVMDYKQLRSHIDNRANTPAPRDARRPAPPAPGKVSRAAASPARQPTKKVTAPLPKKPAAKKSGGPETRKASKARK